LRLITAVAACLLACARASAAPADARAAVSGDDDAPFVIASAGRFVLVDQVDDPYLIGLQYREAPRTGWALRPGLGVDAGADDLMFVYADVARDFALPRRWFVTLSCGVGWFANGERVGADFDLEFRSGIAVARRLASGARLGLAGHHVSNGGLDRPNHGAEMLVLFLTLPVRH
jgi:hypothetical protein